MKKILFGLVLMAGSLMAETHFSFGVGIGVPVAPRPYYYAAPPAYAAPAYAPPAYYGAPAVVIPPCPGPGYSWIAGSWYWNRGHRNWRPGYWAAPRGKFHGGHRGYAWRYR
jgi:hypothetical protein